METTKTTRRRRVAAGTIASAAAICLAFGASLPANATGQATALSHGLSYTKIIVWGVAANVTAVDIVHQENAVTNLCGVQGRYWGTLSNGQAKSGTTPYESNCIPLTFTKRANVNANFQNGSSVTGQAYHDGNWQPGIPGVGIRA